MAAKNNTGNGRRNFYNVAYGKLSTRVKEVTDDLSEIKEDELKGLTQKVENIDLRNKYLVKTGDYPYSVYYDSIEGNIVSIKKDEYDQGISLHIEIEDTDGDSSVIQVKFYSKYTENILNRLANVKNTGSTFLLTPYAIPSEFDGDGGKKIKVYNQGISLRENGEKVEPKFKHDAVGFPSTERVENAEGKLQTSRVKRINFLFDAASETFASPSNNNTTETAEKSKPAGKATPKAEPTDDVEDDDLPF
jgi:hypothetical protein